MLQHNVKLQAAAANSPTRSPSTSPIIHLRRPQNLEDAPHPAVEMETRRLSENFRDRRGVVMSGFIGDEKG
ncbi:hypothetical protein CTI12_AA112410 [Artemisia annua]|uniref:Uncharacterized protein n=1 Tax=Artemisia annua TaxID=35608 RepID=A0A2U1PF45_ARTAN|nr:hypothetical protein CTI12_AA112410 [Artemisia annua]